MFQKYAKIQFNKKSPKEAELFNTDGQTDMTKLIVAIRNFAKSTKNFPRASSNAKSLHKHLKGKEPAHLHLRDYRYAFLTGGADASKSRHCRRLNLNGTSLRIMGILRTNTSSPSFAPPVNSATNDTTD
jgi:hypothetical protein